MKFEGPLPRSKKTRKHSHIVGSSPLASLVVHSDYLVAATEEPRQIRIGMDPLLALSEAEVKYVFRTLLRLAGQRNASLRTRSH